MEQINNINLSKIAKSILHHKKYFVYGLPISFVAACFVILSIPRYYTCTVSMAPEIINSSSSSSISSIASSFGINNLNKIGSLSDALYPEIYPDILGTTRFRIELSTTPVSTKDKRIKTTYYEYMQKYQKLPWWGKIIGGVRMFFSHTEKNNGSQKLNPFMLTKMQTEVIDAIGANINCNVDKRTSIISITVKDQDPLICAVIADSTKNKLQKFITDYRTSKAREDMHYIHKLYIQAKKQYEKSRQIYASYSDANFDAVLTSINSKRDDYENEMQLQYNNYSNLASQYQSAVAKVQERTPAFTILQSASVPVKPAGPKRVIFVLCILMLTFVVLTIFAIYKDKKTV